MLAKGKALEHTRTEGKNPAMLQQARRVEGSRENKKCGRRGVEGVKLVYVTEIARRTTTTKSTSQRRQRCEVMQDA